MEIRIIGRSASVCTTTVAFGCKSCGKAAYDAFLRQGIDVAYPHSDIPMTLPAQSVRLSLITLCLCASFSALQGQVEKPEAGSSRRNGEEKYVRGSIRGRILLPDGSYLSTTVKVTLLTLRDTVDTIYTENQGQFEFPDLIPGNYQIEVEPTDRNNFEVTNEPVQVFKGAPSIVTITLKSRVPRHKSPKVTAVSVSELERTVSPKARKEFEKASQAAQAGKVDQAIAHLRTAIAISPAFVMAYNDLGVQLLSLGKLDESAAAFQRAISLDEKAFNPTLNYGIVLVHLHRFAEANEILAKALTLEPTSAAAHLYSGLAFKALGNKDEAIRELKSAYENGGVEHAIALFHLAEIYLKEGDRNLSRQYLERYLTEVPNAANADQVRRMIAMLK